VAGLIFAAIQVFVFGVSRVGQPVLNIIQFADTMMLLGFLSLVGWFAPGRHRRWPFLLGPALGIVTVLLSGTRGALLAVPVLGLIAFGFALFTAKRKAPVIYAGIGALLVLGLLLLAAPYLGFGRALEAFSTSGNAVTGGEVDSNTTERLEMLLGGWRAFLASPVFGYGWGDMVPAIYPYVDAAHEPAMHAFRHLHNGLVSFAVGGGIVGAVCFIVLSVMPIVAVFYTPRDSQFASRLFLALTLCVAYQVFQLTFLLIGFEFHTVQYALMTMAIVAFVRDPVPQSAEAVGKAAVGSETMKTV
jgi:O-antigen ligase